MQLNPQKIKIGIARTLLRLMPLILMGVLTLATFWLVQSIIPFINQYSSLKNPFQINFLQLDLNVSLKCIIL